MSSRKPLGSDNPVRPAGARGVRVSRARAAGGGWRPVVGGVVVAAAAPTVEETVLIVDSDVLARRDLGRQLSAHGIRCVEVKTAAEIEQRTFDVAPHLILFDLDSAPRDGLALLRHLRGWSPTPVIVLSAQRFEHHKVAALDAGADDYVTKPFGDLELVARVRAALRRSRAQALAPDTGAHRVIEVGPLRVDPIAQEATLAGELLDLTRLELRLLTALAHNAGRVLSPEQLSTAVWGPECGGDAQSLRVYIARLRHLLEVDPARPRWLVTKLRVGYCLRKDADGE